MGLQHGDPVQQEEGYLLNEDEDSLIEQGYQSDLSLDNQKNLRWNKRPKGKGEDSSVGIKNGGGVGERGEAGSDPDDRVDGAQGLQEHVREDQHQHGHARGAARDREEQRAADRAAADAPLLLRLPHRLLHLLHLQAAAAQLRGRRGAAAGRAAALPRQELGRLLLPAAALREVRPLPRGLRQVPRTAAPRGQHAAVLHRGLALAHGEDPRAEVGGAQRGARHAALRQGRRRVPDPADHQLREGARERHLPRRAARRGEGRRVAGARHQGLLHHALQLRPRLRRNLQADDRPPLHRLRAEAPPAARRAVAAPRTRGPTRQGNRAAAHQRHRHHEHFHRLLGASDAQEGNQRGRPHQIRQ